MRKLIPYQQEKLAREMAKDYERAKNKKIEETDPKEIKKVLFKKSVNNDAKKNQEEKMKKSGWTEVKEIFLIVGVVVVIMFFGKGLFQPSQKVLAAVPTVDVPMTQPTAILKEAKVYISSDNNIVVVKKKHHHVVVVAEAVPTAVPTVVPVRGIYVFNNFSGSQNIEVYDEHGLLCVVLPRHIHPVSYDGHAGAMLRFEISDCPGSHHVLGSEEFNDSKTWVIRFSSTDSPYLKTNDLSVLPQKKG
jgi:hypothetical protein